MKTMYLAGLAAGLLLLPGTGRAQTTNPDPGAQAAAAGPWPLPAATTSSQRAVLGGPPQLPATAAAEPAETADLALLLQLPLATTGQPPTRQLQPEELARVFPQGVRQSLAFRPDVAAPATATAVAGYRSLVALALSPGAAGVPVGGASPGQRLQLLTATGERLVAVARPAASGSHTLVVCAEAGLVRQPVFVVGLEHPDQPAIDYEALALLSLRATQELAQQLATVQQQLAALRSQLAAAQQVNSALLLDHAEQEDLKQQFHLLRSQQAALFSAARQRRAIGWSTE